MATDRPTDDLVERMLSAAAGLADARVDRVIAEAAAEAEAEVRAMVKSAMKAALLRRAAARLEGIDPAASLDPEPQTDSRSEPRPARGPVGPAVPAAGDERGSPEARDAERPAEPALRWEPPGTPTSPDPVAASKAPAESDPGWYIYGITRAAADPLPEDLPGIDEAFPLQRVTHEDLTAITSRVSVDAFGRAAPGENGRDLDWVGQKVLAHDRVVKAALAAGPVIPLRFGAVVRSESDVRRILAEHHDRLLDALDALDGKKEWGVKIAIREKALTRQVSLTSDRVRELNGEGDEPDAAGGAASGRAYFRRKKRGEVVREEAGRALREAVADCHRQLSEVASDSAVLPVRAPAPGEAEPPGGTARVAWNGAYLVADDDTERFHALAAELAERYAAHGLEFEVTGPWPPYNFVALDLAVGAAS